MAIREYEFVTGIETSTLPTASTPTVSTDVVTKGYADTTYAYREFFGDAVADITALKAIGTTLRFDKQIRLSEGNGAIYRYDSASTATDDGDTILQPTDLPASGRWLKVSSSSASGGSGGGIDLLMQKVENEHYNVFADTIKNSLAISGSAYPEIKSYIAYLIQDLGASNTSAYMVWNPLQVSTSDKNLDSTTSWTVQNAGATLTTSATRKIGTTSLQFDKNNSAVTASIRYDQGSQIFNIAANTRAYFWINLPSITGLTNVFIRIYSDTTSNYQTFTKTTNSAGGALAVGWNFIFVDLINDTSSATGTGWVYTTRSRYQEIGVTTGSAGQTYTAILVDALNFSITDQKLLGLNGAEVTIHDTSNRSAFIIDASNTKNDGIVTMAASTGQAYTAGISNAAAALVKRIDMVPQGNQIEMDNDAALSGAITTTQTTRINSMLTESVSGTFEAFVDVNTTMVFEIGVVNVSTLDLIDDADLTANLLNTDTIDVFERFDVNGRKQFTYRGSAGLTANSSRSGNYTRITIAYPVGTVAGDFVAKRHVSSARVSLVSKTSNESYSDLDIVTSPNGYLMMAEGYPLPNRANIVGHYFLGSQNAQAAALKNRIGSMPDMVKVGTALNFNETFKKGVYGVSGFTTANYLKLPAPADSNIIAADTGVSNARVQGSYWVYHTSGVRQNHICNYGASGSNEFGWRIYVPASTNTLTMYLLDGDSSPFDQDLIVAGLIPNAWNHVYFHFEDTVSGGHYAYLNGVKSSTYTFNINSNTATRQFTVGPHSDDGFVTNIYHPLLGKISYLTFWSGGNSLTANQVLQLYANGNFVLNSDFNTQLRYRYSKTALSGQKLSMKAALTRSTTAVKPVISKMGAIKQ